MGMTDDPPSPGVFAPMPPAPAPGAPWLWDSVADPADAGASGCDDDAVPTEPGAGAGARVTVGRCVGLGVGLGVALGFGAGLGVGFGVGFGVGLGVGLGVGVGANTVMFAGSGLVTYRTAPGG